MFSDSDICRFLLVLIPSGPSAMVLVSVAESADVSQGEVAGYLTVAVRGYTEKA